VVESTSEIKPKPIIAVSEFLDTESPLIDVRSPAEYDKGHIPGAINLPLFNNDDRAAIGTKYKQSGSKEAVELGLAIVGPRLADLAKELNQAAPTAKLRLYCWRGGMRSNSVAWLAKMIGCEAFVLDGGYKRFRNWALTLFGDPWPIRLLGGSTGSGKTMVLQMLAQKGAAVIDLEAIAHHRGSSYGGLGLPEQPSVEHFENCIALRLYRYAGRKTLWLEAESAQVGSCRIPNGLWQQMQQAPMVLLERSKSERIRNLVETYGGQSQQDLINATERLSRRLGPQRTEKAICSIRNGQLDKACAEILDYYDRSYTAEFQRRQLNCKAGIVRVDASGKSLETIAMVLLQLRDV
jgi:tRNA 2-selenouridine synthase